MSSSWDAVYACSAACIHACMLNVSLSAQELQRSASKQQQQQEEDRGDMPMALMQDLANTLGNLDESGMNGAHPVISGSLPWVLLRENRDVSPCT